jgi:hypothetical protein
VEWSLSETRLVIQIPDISAHELPCRNAWVFKLTGLKAAGDSK